MTAHQLAKELLEGPDLPVVVRNGEPPEPETVSHIETIHGYDVRIPKRFLRRR